MLSALTHSIETARGKRAFLLTIVLGATSVLAHAPFFIWPTFLICTALFFIRLRGVSQHEDKPRRRAFWAGWAFGFGYFLASLFWIASAFLTRGGGYVWLAPLGTALLPMGLAFFWAIAAWLYVKLSQKFTRGPLGAVALFTAIFFIAEFLRGHIFSGFPWNLPGYIWEAGGAISQSASWWGIYGLTFLTLLWAASLGAALIAKTHAAQRFALKAYAPLLIMSLTFVALFGAGQMRLSAHSLNLAEKGGPKIRVISTALTQDQKYNQQNYVQIVNHYLELSFADGAQGVDAIIWSEGAVPGLILEDTRLMEMIDSLLAPEQTLIIGATRRLYDENLPEDHPGGQWRYYNSLIALQSTQTGTPRLVASYDKQKLVPFGEYFPARSLISALNIPALTQAVSSFDHGSGVQPDLPGLPPVSVQICYESIFSGFTENPKDGPQPEWILNISNDSWFGPTSGPLQHFNQVKYRAIEQGIPVVRSAASGISGYADPLGRDIVIGTGQPSQAIDYSLPARVRATLFSRLTD